MRRGFTLMELLIVISVIVILAGILIPAAGMINRYAKWVISGHNMGEIWTGVIAYQQDFDGRDVFPYTLSSLWDPGYPMEAESPKILIDPMDSSPRAIGNNATNRSSGWTDLEFVIQAESRVCSYLYECSGLDFPYDGWYRSWMEPSVDFTQDTWADFKLEQRIRGNVDASGKGIPFDSGRFPVLRSYWHHNWELRECHKNIKKVLNVNWHGSVFKSSPYWEFELNPGQFTAPGTDCH